MGISAKEIVTGRKTFFITPDTSLIPDSYLEEYFALGYECYFIENDKRTKLETKLAILISLFHDVIFFFNVDYRIEGLNWASLIRKIVERYNNQASIGVLYTKRQTKEERQKLEHMYLYDMGLNCGCIQLEYQKKQNFDIIETILYANQAQGRRKNIRALCTSACTYTFNTGFQTVTGSLQDISASHFSFVSNDIKPDIDPYTKIKDFNFNIRGFLFHSSAILIMKRPTPNGILYVFGFLSSNTGNAGLDERLKQLLIPNLYKLMVSNCQTLLTQIFNKVENGENLQEIQELE